MDVSIQLHVPSKQPSVLTVQETRSDPKLVWTLGSPVAHSVSFVTTSIMSEMSRAIFPEVQGNSTKNRQLGRLGLMTIRL
jgi:hypothetical protein